MFCIDTSFQKFRICYNISLSTYRSVTSRNACIIYGLDPGSVDPLQSATELPRYGTFMSKLNVVCCKCNMPEYFLHHVGSRDSVREVLRKALVDGVNTENYQLPLFTKEGSISYRTESEKDRCNK